MSQLRPVPLGARVCRYCSQPLAPHIPANRDFCGEIGCRAASQKDLIAVQDKRRQDEENACRAEVRKLAMEQASRGGFDPDELAVSVLPYNPWDVVPVADDARQVLVNHLQSLVDSLDDEVAEEVYKEPLVAPTVPHLGDHLVAGCATCRGFCCLQGRNHHAFLQRATLKRVLSEQSISKEQLMSQYLEQIPAQSMEKGCLYQGDDGCQLAVELRSDICRDFYCEDMITMMNRHDRKRPDRHLLIATDKNRVRNASLVEDKAVRSIDTGDELSF
ncbi:hypothetical protein [Parendozoicomonas haliclonae]|uniref:Uncharacterized protein n=1 Tax=Parendozoicomonas haliclonae TaxID=1960125 RepID=A0A1X7ATB9_9GAMM|nr:hypothetical protein [Parendozoicomonas haliclonae]SMA50647.1 hypothetical protein EHSB41UT_04464 [Parendozoicomonas haliclonae]